MTAARAVKRARGAGRPGRLTSDRLLALDDLVEGSPGRVECRHGPGLRRPAALWRPFPPGEVPAVLHRGRDGSDAGDVHHDGRNVLPDATRRVCPGAVD